MVMLHGMLKFSTVHAGILVNKKQKQIASISHYYITNKASIWVIEFACKLSGRSQDSSSSRGLVWTVLPVVSIQYTIMESEGENIQAIRWHHWISSLSTEVKRIILLRILTQILPSSINASAKRLSTLLKHTQLSVKVVQDYQHIVAN